MVATRSIHILSFAHLREIIPLSRSQIWRLEQAGAFPRRIRIGLRRVGWRASDIENWLLQRAQTSSRRGKPAVTAAQE